MSGYCHRSGECCRKLAFKVNVQERMMELLKAHGLMDEDCESGEVQLTVWHECQHLRWDGFASSCAIYEDRPQICRDFKCQRMLGVPVTQLRTEFSS